MPALFTMSEVEWSVVEGTRNPEEIQEISLAIRG